MAKYAVFYQGFAYVEADSPEEAEEAYRDDDVVYSEAEVTAVSEVYEFVVNLSGGTADG